MKGKTVKAEVVSSGEGKYFMLTVPDMCNIAVGYAENENDAENMAKGFDIGFAFAMSVVKEAKGVLK